MSPVAEPKPWTPGLRIERNPWNAPPGRWEFSWGFPWVDGVRVVTVQGWPALVLLCLTTTLLFAIGYVAGLRDAGAIP